MICFILFIIIGYKLQLAFLYGKEYCFIFSLLSS